MTGFTLKGMPACHAVEKPPLRLRLPLPHTGHRQYLPATDLYPANWPAAGNLPLQSVSAVICSLSRGPQSFWGVYCLSNLFRRPKALLGSPKSSVQILVEIEGIP